jgi:tetratricopeptide (TPR) repeat protein
LILIAFSRKPVAAQEARGKVAASSLSTKARQLAAAGQTEQAIKILQAELRLHSQELEARLTLADIYASKGDRNSAETEYREALSSQPNSGAAALALGEFYLSTGSLSEAEQVLADALRVDPQLGEARLQLTLVLAGEHKYAEAERTLARVSMPATPEDKIRYYRMAASIHSGMGEKKAAAQDMEKALAAAPQDEQLQMLTALTEAGAADWNHCAQKLAPLFIKNPTAKIGLLLLQAQLTTRQDFSATLQALRNLSLPDNQALELALRSAELLAQAEQHEEAAREFARALAFSGKDPNIAYNLAVERYAAGKIEPALQELNSLRQNADSAEVEDLIADIEEQRGDGTGAIRDHENAANLAPSEERYRLTLGAALLRTHAYQRAQEIFQKAIEAFPNSARSYVGFALAMYMMEQYEESASAFLHAAQLENNSGRIWNYLGSTQTENPSGPSQQAIDGLCTRADANPRDAVAAEWCGALLFRKAYITGDRAGSEPAIARLRLATALAPKDPVAYCFLGRALFWSGKTLEARRWLETCVRLDPESAEEHYRLSQVYQELNLKQAAAQQSALAESLKSKAGQQSPTEQNLALEVLDAATRPTIHAETGATSAPALSPNP